MLPGTKIQLVGSIDYNYKTVLLWPNNMKIIGGCVPEIGTTEYLKTVQEQAIKLLYDTTFKNLQFDLN